MFYLCRLCHPFVVLFCNGCGRNPIKFLDIKEIYFGPLDTNNFKLKFILINTNKLFNLLVFPPSNLMSLQSDLYTQIKRIAEAGKPPKTEKCGNTQAVIE